MIPLKKIYSDKILLGDLYKHPNFSVFFGAKQSDPLRLQNYFNTLEFYYLNQVHGTSAVQANKTLQNADLHFTSIKQSALCIKTADCLPIFIYHTQKIIALHA